MGWASGSLLMSSIIEVMNEVNVGPDDKKVIYERLIDLFMDYDCDTIHECLGEDEIFDQALRTVDPEAFEEDE